MMSGVEGLYLLYLGSPDFNTAGTCTSVSLLYLHIQVSSSAHKIPGIHTSAI